MSLVNGSRKRNETWFTNTGRPRRNKKKYEETETKQWSRKSKSVAKTKQNKTKTAETSDIIVIIIITNLNSNANHLNAQLLSRCKFKRYFQRYVFLIPSRPTLPTAIEICMLLHRICLMNQCQWSWIYTAWVWLHKKSWTKQCINASYDGQMNK